MVSGEAVSGSLGGAAEVAGDEERVLEGEERRNLRKKRRVRDWGITKYKQFQYKYDPLE